MTTSTPRSSLPTRLLRLSVAAALGLASSTLAACDGPSQSATATPSVGASAPALSGVDLHGQPFELSAQAGKVVIVDFWASWCEPCKRAMPGLEALAAEYAGQVVVVGVSVDDDPVKMREFVERMGVSFVVIHDADDAIASRWAPPTMPTTYVIDSLGGVAAVHEGYDETMGAEALRDEIDALLDVGP
ncbi:TlpA family protein disulfide reductase [Pseudenhygromyxa sp. WMMC2535]|uniref:TlpA family protein disulfide reductase n=1 Tax=Pseudenhygromyxa sp. WMMC2535 TaxID=2712867 RepID=UPI0015517E26|nr:TlpA disulfide reductase family protein [Pseudenhygromyxa sp. WMMC2535]NVB39111.1 TlpA family protein disulfide reductase [Pseudenhygromyxa sp. WMMC2535]